MSRIFWSIGSRLISSVVIPYGYHFVLDLAIAFLSNIDWTADLPPLKADWGQRILRFALVHPIPRSIRKPPMKKAKAESPSRSAAISSKRFDPGSTRSPRSNGTLKDLHPPKFQMLAVLFLLLPNRAGEIEPRTVGAEDGVGHAHLGVQ